MKDVVIGDYIFKKTKKLGKGSYGKVYNVVENGKNYALKVIKNKGDEGIKSLKELDIMSRIFHPNINHAEKIVSHYDLDKGVSKVGILMELAHTDLHDVVDNREINVAKRIDILKQVTKGLVFIHKASYLHLDIKPANILLYHNNVAKLSDFGLSLRTEGTNNKYKEYPLELITITHRSINVLKGDRVYTEKDDIWALGITILETLSYGKRIFSGFKKDDYISEKILDVLEDVFNPNDIDVTLNSFLVYIPGKLRKRIIPMLKNMLNFDPAKRPTAMEVLSVFTSDVDIGGYTLEPPVYDPESCSIMNYEGFDVLTRFATRVPIQLETYFLAVDIYQRQLAYSHTLTGVWEKDYKNTVFQATLSLYIAVKIVETYFADPKVFTNLVNNTFSEDYLFLGETALTNAWNGVLYRNNFFTYSSTTSRLYEAFELSRDCRIYRFINLLEWKKLNDVEEKTEGVYENKWGKFLPFFMKTPYYVNLFDPSLKYLDVLYEEDKKKFE